MGMGNVTIRDLRNHGGDVVARVNQGETLTVTRDGKPVAELRPLGRAPQSAAALLERWQRLPHLDGEALKGDLDAVLDASL
jgi:prevent-host-death family protein